MRTTILRPLTLVAAALGLAPALQSAAEVTRAEITSRADVQNGAEFGAAGAYELLSGRIYFAVDPKNARNRVIADLDKAPRNAAGLVELSADLAILKPKDAARANGTLLLDVVNRGNKTVLSGFNRAAATPRDAASAPNEYGDGLLMRLGFTVVWVGWEFDVPQRPGAIRISVPEAEGVHTTVRSLVTPNAAAPTAQFPDLSPYAPVDVKSAASRLTVRDGALGLPTPIARERWTQDGTSVTLEGGFVAGRTYELSYETRNAPVAGLGFAAVRDTVAWIKRAPDAPVHAQRALGFGASQSGRYLRTFLYLGFNADEQNRQVFDGVMAHIAGAARLDLNRRGSTPTSLGMFDATSFPFADAALKDPVTGAAEGALDNPRTKDFAPKVFYTNTGVEYWGGGRSAALVHMTPDGREDLTPPDNVRVYFLTGTQHGPGRFPPAEPGNGAQRENPTDYWYAMRALLVAMDAWVRDGTAPPPSRRPRLADGTLARSTDVAFPDIPGVRSPRTLQAATRGTNTLVARDGAPGTTLPYLVPQTDRDGNELAGIRLPDIEVPLATYTGWNFRNPSIGGETQLFPLLGSYLPFPARAADGSAPQDPRAPIADRYASKAAYIERVRAAGERLVAARYLRAEDLQTIVTRAERHWDLVAQ
jgi:hypothetical protein